jgi:hypothetical protein
LIDKIHRLNVKKFTERTDALYSQFFELDTALSAEHNTIDEIIKQIDFIKMHYHNRDMLEDMISQLMELKEVKGFCDKLRIYIPSQTFQKYLELYLEPVKVRELITSRHNGLDLQRA